MDQFDERHDVRKVDQRDQHYCCGTNGSSTPGICVGLAIKMATTSTPSSTGMSHLGPSQTISRSGNTKYRADCYEYRQGCRPTAHGVGRLTPCGLLLLTRFHVAHPTQQDRDNWNDGFLGRMGN